MNRSSLKDLYEFILHSCQKKLKLTKNFTHFITHSLISYVQISKLIENSNDIQEICERGVDIMLRSLCHGLSSLCQ